MYLNGCLLKHNFSTYTSFEVDITDYAVCGGENVLVVHIELPDFEGWWYEGAGIYRNVWLTVTDQIAVDTDGVYINPQRIGGTEWMVLLETTLVSAAAKDEAVSVLTEIIDAECRTLPPPSPSIPTAWAISSPPAPMTAIPRPLAESSAPHARMATHKLPLPQKHPSSSFLTCNVCEISFLHHFSKKTRKLMKKIAFSY